MHNGSFRSRISVFSFGTRVQGIRLFPWIILLKNLTWENRDQIWMLNFWGIVNRESWVGEDSELTFNSACELGIGNRASGGDSHFTVHAHPDQLSQLSIMNCESLGRGEDLQFTFHSAPYYLRANHGVDTSQGKIVNLAFRCKRNLISPWKVIS